MGRNFNEIKSKKLIDRRKRKSKIIIRFYSFFFSMKNFQDQRDLAEAVLNNSDLQENLQEAEDYSEAGIDKIHQKELIAYLKKSRYAVSGVMQNYPERKLKEEPDLDGEASLFLFRLAGVNIKPENLTYVEPGKTAKNSIVLDTGNEFGTKYD